MDTDEFGCPRCKTTKYRNPKLRLLVNSCGHSLCQSCMEVLFVKGAGPCPDCGIILRRVGFREQLFDDPFVEREVDIRRRILKDYCKTEEDFNSLLEYNDYLEEIEHIVYNLVLNTDVIETNKKIEHYKKVNIDQIKRARIHGNPRLHELDAILEEERLTAERRNYEKTVLEKDEQKRRQKTNESLIDNLMFSDVDAKAILTEHKMKVEQQNIENKSIMETKKTEFAAAAASASANAKGKGSSSMFSSASGAPTIFSTGLSTGSKSSKTHVIPVKEELFVYEDIQYVPSSIPTIEDIIANANGINYLANFRETTLAEISGGYHISRSCHRFLVDILDQDNIVFDPETEGAHASTSEDDYTEADVSEFGMDLN